MFFNNLKIALRSLRKNKIYTFITLFGLAVGVAASLLIFRMLKYELSFNESFEKYERIVRVVNIESRPEEGEIYHVCTPLPAMDIMEDRVSQFEAMSRVKEFWPALTVPDPNGGPPLKKFTIQDHETAFFVEPEFFDIFDVEWLEGQALAALSDPSSIVLNRSWAEKMFDSPEEAVGQLLVLNNAVTVTVRGVVEDLPTNSDFPIPFFVSWQTLLANADHFFLDNRWGSCSSNNQVYALLNSADQVEAANAVLAEVGQEHYSQQTSNRERWHILQPLSTLHFDERIGHSGTHQISRSRLQILAIIGILIIIMACFNFINLATAQASLRAREVGVRKTLGSSRRQLVGQFMSEIGLIVFFAVFLGVNLANFLLPFLKYISDVPETLPFLSDPTVWIYLAVVIVLVTLLAGLYPSLVMAGFRPVQALKKEVSRRTFSGATLRKSLVILQFIIAQGLIVSAVIVLSQLNYIQSKDLGFAKDLVYTFNLGTDSASLARQQPLKQELLRLPNVEAVSFCSDFPLSNNTWAQNFRYASRAEEETYPITNKFGDADYQKTHGIRLLAGRWYDPSDTIRQGVVNMTLLRKLGITDPNEVVGQQVFLGGRRPVDITGVMEDFHTYSLHSEHRPLLMTTQKIFHWGVGVKIRPENIPATLASIQEIYDRILPEQILDGRFMDERIDQYYEDEARLSTTCKGFGLLAILISCLGLFGLAAHAAQQKVKEIGIRKVLGASVSSIINLLSKEFILLVTFAFLIATPVAWYLMNEWLADFAYSIDIQWWMFAFAGFGAITIAFLTVSFQSIKAALADPVESLRNE